MAGKRQKVYLGSIHLDCKPHSVLSAQVYHYLKSNDHYIVEDPSNADFIILNSCGFIEWYERSTEKAIKTYLSMNENTTLIVIGCLTRINRERIEKFTRPVIITDLRELDDFFLRTSPFARKDAFSNSELTNALSAERQHNNELVQFIENVMAAISSFLERIGISPFPMNKISDEDKRRQKILVDIGSGCIGNCSYCIIKKAKDTIQSRPIDDIIADIEKASNVHENDTIDLVADDCSSYGIDIGTSLLDLLDAIGSHFPSKGIDITYIYPRWLERHGKAFIERCRKYRINSLNISMQSGSNLVLRLMNRRYNVSRILDIIKEIKKASPSTLVWTHFMVGFPGETRKEFMKTVRTTSSFHYWYVFKYSDREGTRSVTLPGKVSFIIKSFRKLLLKMLLYLSIARGVIRNLFSLKRFKSPIHSKSGIND
ncbi:radical SAM protein [Candidatus Bathyarchaeota archaeon]|nr:radical SAM protein [Candidatus Bathyarchaeota archaeon]